MSSKNVKKRNWAFVGYPESLPDDWKDQLIQTGLPFAVSPLHEFDTDPTGEVKKPHYHFILCYSGPTSFNVVKALTDRLNSPIPLPLEQVKGYYRYFTHKDNPEKFQYDEHFISTYNGFDIFDYTDLTNHEQMEIKLRVHQLADEFDIVEYYDMLSYLLSHQMLTEYDYVSNHTFHFHAFFKSRHYRQLKLDVSHFQKETPS